MYLYRLTFLDLIVLSLVLSVFGQDKIDGGWTEWSIMSDSDCSKPCGGGVQTIVRTCTNPKPHNGKNCVGPDKREVKCNEESCDEKIDNSIWLDWSVCSTTCGRGTRERIKKCVKGEDDGFTCDKIKGKTHEVEKCEMWEPFEKDKCPGTCDQSSDEYSNIDSLKQCPDKAKCTDDSTDMGPKRTCKCVMGSDLDHSNWVCKGT